ncbi:hypothetical protein L53_00940 [Hyphomonas sp. L-53-1-40]|uniref:hypothetical protein n=1 Tax=Hyphomonas sp. L-53-1-40 TaxID=1207058 RepID=UPI000458B17F|nr:hypothetical protein [Hyphomonas sp. L-53-1-40]KCZ65907.1 hypothetical protein L53_00940 [Hyphomonas sp. L-53-1-40]
MTSGNTPNRDHTESLRRLLRRRGRRGKAGANPHTDTTLHAWHSSYTHTPGSSHSPTTRWIVAILAIIFIYVLPVAIALMRPLIINVDPHNLESLSRDVIEMLIRTTIVLALLLVASVFGLALLAPLMWFWKQLDGDSPAVRKRLIARADRIIAKRQAKATNSDPSPSEKRQETEA